MRCLTVSPVGPKYNSAMLCTVINWMRLGLDAQAAINAPRCHHQWLPGRVLMEQQFPAPMEQGLNAMGHATKRRGHIGLVNAVGIDSQTGERLGAADPRDEGSAVGYYRRIQSPAVKFRLRAQVTMQKVLSTYLF